MDREERKVFFKEVRKVIKHGASKPTLVAMLVRLPDDSEKAKFFRRKLQEMI